MHQRVLVVRGMLCRGNLSYPLTDDVTGVPATGDYRGTAWVADGLLVIGNAATQAHLACYRIGEATPESLLYAAGFEHGEQQRRCAWPNGKPERYVDGWRQAWSERDASALRGFAVEPATGRMVRWATLRRKERGA